MPYSVMPIPNFAEKNELLDQIVALGTERKELHAELVAREPVLENDPELLKLKALDVQIDELSDKLNKLTNK